MITPNIDREDNTVATITLVLDGVDTEHWKKAKCFVCGGTVFSYRDSLNFALPVDGSEFYGEEDFNYLTEDEARALTQVECTHFIRGYGQRKRCGTVYILLRGNYKVEAK